MRKNQSVGWGVGVAAQEDADQQVVDRLRSWKIRVDPELIAGLQVRNSRYGKCLAVAGNANVNLGSDQIEA